MCSHMPPGQFLISDCIMSQNLSLQVENEFGSYGDDKAYLRQLVALARKHLGDETILYVILLVQ